MKSPLRCPRCGRCDCAHTASDIGLSQSEFLVYIVFRTKKDCDGDPAIESAREKIRQKVASFVRMQKGKQRSSLAA